VLASSIDVASVGSAWILVIAVLYKVLAASGGIARGYSAGVRRLASERSEDASSGSIASIGGAKVVVIASYRGVSATSTIDGNIASIYSALIIVVAGRWANTLALASAESSATSSARSAWKINASGDNKLVYDSLQSAEAGNSRERSLNSGNAGSNEVDLVLVDSSTNSKGKDNDSLLFGTIHDCREGSGVHVVLAISKHDENRGYMPSSRGDFILSTLDSASNASRSSSLVNGVHGIEEPTLGETHLNGESGISRELD